MGNEEWRFAPAALSHVYWKRKEQFEYPQDVYREWVLFAVTEGRFRYRIGNAGGTASFGDLVFCPPGTAFHREAVEPVSFHFYRFRWERQFASDSDETGSPRPAGAHPVQDRKRLASAYGFLERLTVRDEEQRLAMIQSVFQVLWQMLCSQHEVENLPSRDDEPGDELMKEAALWIKEFAYQPLRLRDFCEGKPLSAVQFTRRFRAVWGQTPMAYLTYLRMEKAKRLLLETRLTLDDIAVQCGYENGFYLSRIFTDKMKEPPSEFRKSHML